MFRSASSSSRMVNLQRLQNARYAKLLINWRKEQREVFYRRIRKVVTLTAPTRISGKIIRNVTCSEQCIEISPIKFPSKRRNQCTMISQDYIIKVISNKCRMSDIVPRLAILSHYDLSCVKTEPINLFTSGTCQHKTLPHFFSNSPVVVDISIVAKANRQFAWHSLLVNAANTDIGNIT